MRRAATAEPTEGICVAEWRPPRLAGGGEALRIAALGALLLAVAACTSKPLPRPSGASAKRFAPSSECRNCHTRIADQHAASMHAKSFENPVFQVQYYDQYLASLHEDPSGFKTEPDCLACHAPAAYQRSRYLANQGEGDLLIAEDDCKACHPTTSSSNDFDDSASGVTCDLCHRISSFRGPRPSNGNYVATPGQPKFGPFEQSSDWHHAYAELQTKSEVCAICHESVNRFGLRIRTTFTEWQQSRFAKEGIQCQDCHMNAKGFLTAGKAVYESGRAATMTLGSAPERDRLYTHRFFGVHSKSQIEGALTLEIATTWPVIRPGDNVPLWLSVGNEKTGHNMPSGSAELRAVWLEVTARADDFPVPLRLGGDLNPYGISGARGARRSPYSEDVPPGQRLYTAVFVDKQGRPTLTFFDAVQRVFDNRLRAGEVRRENLYLRVPHGVTGEIEVVARLHYLRYPKAFAQRLGLPEQKPIPFAEARQVFRVQQ